MVREIKSKDIMTQSDLIEAVKYSWDEIDQKVIDNYIDSMFGKINYFIFTNCDKININNLDYSIKKN